VHISAVERSGLQGLKDGQKVSLRADEGPAVWQDGRRKPSGSLAVVLCGHHIDGFLAVNGDIPFLFAGRWRM
jgi:hypothetical protein